MERVTPIHNDANVAPADSGCVALATIAAWHDVAADPAQLADEFASDDRPLDAAALVRAARRLGLRARALQSSATRLARTPLPALVQYQDGEWRVLAALSERAALVQEAGAPTAQTIARDAFLAQWCGQLILVAGTEPGAPRARFGLRWFIPHLLRHRAVLAEVLLAAGLVQLLALVTPLFFQVIIDKVLAHRGLTTLDVLAVGLLIVSLFEVLLASLRTYLLTHTTSRIDVALGSEVFGHALSLPLAYFAARRTGDTVARIRELDSVREFVTGSALTVAIDALFIAVFFVVMAFYSTTLTLVVAATLPAYALLALVVTPMLRARVKEKFDRGADNQATLFETVAGIETVKAAAVEAQCLRHFEARLAAYVKASRGTAQLASVATQTAQLINKLMVLAILWHGAHLVLAGALSVGQLVAFNMLAARIAAPVLRLVQLWQDFQQAGVSVARLGDILNAPAERRAPPGASPPVSSAGKISFERVSFSYAPEAPDVLSDCTFTINAGEVVGVLGASGSGKSTLARLVQGLYHAQRGRVLIDGLDVRHGDVRALRRQVGVVLQDNVLFNRSVRDNIALARPAAPLSTVMDAARLAGAHDFITTLPMGYDTPVVEQGGNLSGGQRQRLALARALLADPRILILDEASSALDYDAEAELQRNMARIRANRTVIIIAHRFSALRVAERLLVLDEGRVREDGTHAELMSGNGMYARLFREHA